MAALFTRLTAIRTKYNKHEIKLQLKFKNTVIILKML